MSSYEIVFSYQGPCSGFTHTNTTTVEGTSRNYTLSGLQEFSNYTVSVTAVNDAGNATGTVVATTLGAGTYVLNSGLPIMVLPRSSVVEREHLIMFVWQGM